MSIYIDKKFVSRLSGRLDKFVQKSDFLWNFRCIICGDSQKNKYKARGYIYRRANGLFYSCHNCNVNLSLGNFIKAIDRSMYDEYILETFSDGKTPQVPKPNFDNLKTNLEMEEKFSSKIDLPTITSLPEEHLAKVFLLRRQIPRERFGDLYYASDFKDFIDSLNLEKDHNLVPDEKRIVIPFRDENKKLLGVQGRALFETKVRYISVKLKTTNRKLFGLDTVNFNQPISIVEGPFDSMFLDNSIAVMDSALYSVIPTLGPHDYIFVYDNERKNSQILHHMDHTIKLGQKICIWPRNLESKDINDMVLAGLYPKEIIQTHTFEGIRARLEFETWRK